MKTLGLAALFCLAALTALAAAAAAAPAVAQEPSPGTESPCAQGQLCDTGGGGGFTTVPTGKVNDPPGAVARSLTVIGLIVGVLTAYLYVALGGKPVPLLGRRSKAV